MSAIELRDGLEIQRAHDILRSVIRGEVPIDTDDADPIVTASLHSALDTLCWVLNHRHNSAFSDNLDRIEKVLEAKGFVLRLGGKKPS